MRTIAQFFRRQGAAREIPFGRVSIVVQLLGVVLFLTYVLANTGVRLPLVENPYEMKVAFRDAAGLDEDNRPTAGVAGIALGRVVEVTREGGQAVATLEFDEQVRGKVYRDATAEVRPINAVNQLVVNVDPGTPKSGPLPEGELVSAEATSTYVSLDRLFEVLDVDTRAYLQVVINELGRAFEGRGGELRSAVAQLGELTDPAARVSDQLADRRVLLARLVDGLNVVFAELERRDESLAEVIAAGSDTLAVTAANETGLAGLMRELPPTMVAAREALQGGRRLSEPLVPALERLGAASEPLPATLRDARDLLPDARDLLDRVDALTRDGQDSVRLLAGVSRKLEPTAGLAERPVRRLQPLVALLDSKKQGIRQTTELFSGVVSTDDENGVRVRTVVLPEPVNPENLGLGADSARTAEGEANSPLERKLARALEAHCSEELLAACLLRLRVPGLPGVPAVESGGGTP